MFDTLKMQIEKTTKNLERGDIQLSDRIFLNHILDEVEYARQQMVTAIPTSSQIEGLGMWYLELLGGTDELVREGLE